MIKKFIILLFSFSLVICFGAYFLLQHVPDNVQDTEIVGDNELTYFDYDFTKKIEQLNNFRSIFTLDTIYPTAPSDLMTPVAITGYPALDEQIQRLNIVINSIDISYVDNGETVITTIKYYDYTALGKLAIFFNPEGIGDPLSKYINVDNLQSYLFDVYSIEYDSDLTTKVLYAFDKLFTYLSVPLKWVYNFIYDIYVFLQILVIW